MKRALLLLGFLALAPAPARADEWTATDTALQLTVLTLQLADWGQTHWNLEHGGREYNPLLGTHPSENRIRLTVTAAILGHALVSYVLPRPYRTIWQCVWMGVEGNMVWTNYHRQLLLTGGLRMSW